MAHLQLAHLEVSHLALWQPDEHVHNVGRELCGLVYEDSDDLEHLRGRVQILERHTRVEHHVDLRTFQGSGLSLSHIDIRTHGCPEASRPARTWRGDMVFPHLGRWASQGHVCVEAVERHLDLFVVRLGHGSVPRVRHQSSAVTVVVHELRGGEGRTCHVDGGQDGKLCVVLYIKAGWWCASCSRPRS